MGNCRKTYKEYFRDGPEGREPCFDPFGHQRFLGGRGWTPGTDILESDDAVLIVIDLAGVEKEAIRVCVEDDLLLVSGVRKRKQIPGAKRFHRMEIDYGPFERRFRLSRDLDLDGLHAEYREGFLELSLPKKKKELIQIVIVHDQ